MKNEQEEAKKKPVNKITSFFEVTKSSSTRGIITDRFMNAIDPEHIPRNFLKKSRRKGCPNCNVETQILHNYTNGTRACSYCGMELDHFFDPQFNSYKETQAIEMIPEFSYKRINHFNEWLAQIQAKENTEIPEQVFTSLRKEFKKHKIKDYKLLTHDFVKDCLKKLNLNRFYEHIEYIIHRFNGLPPPVLSMEMEERFRSMFIEIQVPFEKCKPKTRKNFLSYSYVFHKFAELLELDDILKCFPLLKSREKLFQQDFIWKGMCKLLRWQFIASV